MFRHYYQPFLVALFCIHGKPFANPHNQTKPVCRSHLNTLYQTYDEKSHYPLKLSFDHTAMGLCLQRVGADNNPSGHFIALPESVTSVDIAVTTGQQHIVAGKNSGSSSFLQSIDNNGNLLWQYPLPLQKTHSQPQFYDLALSDNKSVLIAAGSENGRSMIWHFSLGKSGISQMQKISAADSATASGSYRQVITGSGNEFVVVHRPDQNDLPTTLEKWYRQNEQWQHITDFCSQLSLHVVSSTALKAEQSGQSFFFIASQPRQTHFYQIDRQVGRILGQLTADALFQWDYTARIETPSLLSVSSALAQEAKNKISLFQEQVAQLNDNLLIRSSLLLTNRGCLLGISSSFSGATPLVINLCSVKNKQEGLQRRISAEKADFLDISLSFGFIIKSILMATGVVGLPVLCIKGFQFFHSLLTAQPQLPGETLQEKLHKKRLEHLAKNPAFSKPQVTAEHQGCFTDPSGEITLKDFALKDKSRLSELQQETFLKLLILALTSNKEEQEASKTVKGTITKKMLSDALAKIRFPQTSTNNQHKKPPDELTLRPMPEDHYCFYHAIGQAAGFSGSEIFHYVVDNAQSLLQNAPELSESLVGVSSYNNLKMIADMANKSRQQIWGNQEMLPFICWLLNLHIAVVTPGSWYAETGGLIFFPDGNWEMLNGNSDSLLSQLRESQNTWPELLIIQHNGHNHWDVLEWAEER